MEQVEQETVRARCGRVKSLEPPPEVVKWLNAYGGMNRYGEPNYRLVWSGNAKSYRTKQWVDKDDHGNIVRKIFESRECLKYQHPSVQERFILEAWRDPLDIAFGDRDEWKRANTKFEDGRLIQPLGDFPSRGDYVLCGVVLDIDGEGFAWPASEYLKADIELRNFAHRQLSPRRAEEIANEVREKEEQAEVDSIYDRIRDNAVFNRNPYVTLANRAAFRA